MEKSTEKGRKYTDLFLYGLVISLIKIVHVLPFSFACRVGELLGLTWFHLYRRHRQITLQNLEKALGETFSNSRRIGLAKEAYKNFGRIFMECIFLPRFTERDIREFVSIIGTENLEAAEKQGKGLFFITAHFSITYNIEFNNKFKQNIIN